jgi:glycosyltransferase involved in cell wall biosynthesis
MNTDTPKKQILFLMSDLGGGTGNHLLQMIKQWPTDIYQSHILSDAKLSSRITPEVPLDFFSPLPYFDHYPLSQIHRFKQVVRYATQHKPVLLHAYFFWPIIYGRLLKLLGKIKVLVENREDQGFNWGKHEYALLRLTRGLPNRVICVSDAVRQTVLEKEHLAPEKAVVIHNGITAKENAGYDRGQVRDSLGFRDDHLVVGMVANFNRAVKGVEYFIEAIPLIVTQCPSARFLLLGRGKYEAELRHKAQSLGVEHCLKFGGYQADIDRFYAAMDLSVLTSLSEGLSITLLESMNHALPIVATRVGGNPEVIVSGETGFLVPPKDTLAFAEKVVLVLKDPQLARRLGEAGKERVRSYFSLSATAEKYLKVYEITLGEGST